MDRVLHGNAKQTISDPWQVFRQFSEIVALIAIGAGIAYGSSWLAGRMGLAVSRGLLVEGRWLFRSWGDFPWLDCVGMLAGMGALPVWWELRSGHRLREIGFSVPRRWILYLVLAVGMAAVFTRASGAPLTFLRSGLSVPAFMFFGAYFLCVAVAEEILFRGVLQRRVKERSNSFLAIGISTLIFLFWHGLDFSAPEFCLRIAGGAVLGILYDRSGSLLPPILLHWLINIGQV
jgi:membrane protease YdiL (CAAX protease family)